MSVVEKMARAIYDALKGPVNNQDFGRQMRQWELAQRLAIAALKAMREPTEVILDAMHDRIRILVDPEQKTADIQNDREVWQAMIDAAIQTQGGEG